MTNATKEGEEPIQISDDVSVQMVGVSAFTIYMKNSEGRVETVELLEATNPIIMCPDCGEPHLQRLTVEQWLAIHPAKPTASGSEAEG